MRKTLRDSIKRVLLVSPERHFTMSSEMYPSGALLLLGTMLKKRGHEVKMVHMVADRVSEDELVASVLREFKPDIVGITVSTFQVKQAKSLSEKIKKLDENVKVIIGGPHPSAFKQHALDGFAFADVAVIGEGEQSTIEITEDVPLAQVKGICYREGPDTIFNPRGDLLADLDSLPFPDLGFVDLNKYLGPHPMGKRPSMFMMASRGCPFQCTFCSKSIYGDNVRFHSPDYVISQVEYLNKYFGVREIFFQDDTFNVNRQWAESILHQIISKGLNKKMIFRTDFRVNEKLVDLELLRLVRRAGFWLLFYGVESGNQSMLDRMKKGISVDEVRRAFRLSHEAGIKTEASFVIGLPGETESTIVDSIKLWREIKPDWTGFSRAIPFPGTLFEDEVRRKGHLLVSDFESYSVGKTMVRTDEMTAEQLEDWARRCDRYSRDNALRTVIRNPSMLLQSVGDRITNLLKNGA
jgi:anaerobic magnesium-protoporphyrin IX monomethyl ester cyclase